MGLPPPLPLKEQLNFHSLHVSGVFPLETNVERQRRNFRCSKKYSAYVTSLSVSWVSTVPALDFASIFRYGRSARALVFR